MKFDNLEEHNQFCPIHKQELRVMYGCGWDYDKLLCPICLCDYEIELETTSYPEGVEE